MHSSRLSFKEGYELTLKNSEGLFKISELAAQQNEFGIACSLNILAAEEALKASFLITQHYHPGQKVNDIDEIFRNHKIKHKHLKAFVHLKTVLNERTKKNLALFEPHLKTLENRSKEGKLANKALYDSLKKDIEWFKKQLKNDFDDDAMINWLTQANTDKNLGFYVDKKDDVWTNPQVITKSKFLKEREYTNAIFQLVKGFEETFQRSEVGKKRS